MQLRKLFTTMAAGCLVLASSMALAAPKDDLTAALNRMKDPVGTYNIEMKIPFAHLDTLTSHVKLDLQTSPYVAHAVINTTMGKQSPSVTELYEIQEGNQIKTYNQELLHSGDKTKSWVYSYSPAAKGSISDSLEPESLLGSVSAVQSVSNAGGVEHLKVTFDSNKLFSDWGIKHTVEQTAKSDPKTDKDFEEQFEKLRKSGPMYGDVYIINGRMSKFEADISKPVKAFETVIKHGVSRKSHTGALGNWILGMILKTNKSTMTLNCGALTHSVSIPQSVINAAVPEPKK